MLVAKRLGYAVLIDDGFGRRLAERKGLRLFSTEDLAVELLATGTLDEPAAWELYRRVFRNHRRSELTARAAALHSHRQET